MATVSSSRLEHEFILDRKVQGFRLLSPKGVGIVIFQLSDFLASTSILCSCSLMGETLGGSFPHWLRVASEFL